MDPRLLFRFSVLFLLIGLGVLFAVAANTLAGGHGSSSEDEDMYARSGSSPAVHAAPLVPGWRLLPNHRRMANARDYH